MVTRRCKESDWNRLLSKQSECVHHFSLPTPDGPTSMGKCIKCGLTREHRNALPALTAWTTLKRNMYWRDRETTGRCEACSGHPDSGTSMVDLAEGGSVFPRIYHHFGEMCADCRLKRRGRWRGCRCK